MAAEGISALFVAAGAAAIGHALERRVTRGAVLREQRMTDGERAVGDEPTWDQNPIEDE